MVSQGVIGNGDIASALSYKSGLLFFASGVSNSRCTDEKQYDHEAKLLLAQDNRAHIVYFSSLAIFYSDTRYTRHKLYMETLIRETFSNWTIVRIGNIDWGKNPNTLINYLCAHPEAEIRDEYRYIVNKEEFLHWINLIPEWSCELNIPGKRMKVRKIKEKYCVEK